MKTYVLTVSKNFPNTHKRKGEPTYFIEKLGRGLEKNNVQVHEEFGQDIAPKLHTIRSNYELWKDRFKEIDAGRACLSIRYWSGKAYRSKQVEVARLTNEHGIGLQKLVFNENSINKPTIEDDKCITFFENGSELIAKNDGLKFDDFQEWFKDYDLNDPMAIIHFTKFRY